MRLLITGGAGFIGSNLGDKAIEAGWKVAVLDDLSSGRRENVPDAAEFFQVDIRCIKDPFRRPIPGELCVSLNSHPVYPCKCTGQSFTFSQR